MTTKPKGKKFRIRLAGDRPVSTPRAPTPPVPSDTVTEDGLGSQPFPTASTTPTPEAAPELTVQQLRMARRLAHKQGLTPESDEEAVQMLRAQGIDPFAKSARLKLVAPDSEADRAVANLPEPVAETPPATSGPAARAADILAIQRDIARRRRRRLTMLGVRLMAFVLLPTILAAYYFFAVATPLYATNSEFVIQQADGQNSGLGGLFSGTGLATSQDSITVQSYLQSRESMLRLDSDIGFKAHFSQDWIDPITRLDPEATNEEAYRHYTDHVRIGFDPTEGIIKMEVTAADPDTSAAFSRALIAYAEEQVDTLSLRLREDQMRGAMDSFREAERRMEEAQSRVLELQERLGVLDPASESASIMGQISTFETQLAEKRLQREQLLDNPSPNAARVAGVEGDIARLERLISDLRAQLTENDGSTGSLASITAQLQVAEVDLETRTMMMQESLQQLETARIEANRQVRYLSTGVNPIPPDEPTYPRAFENTLLAFFIFAGIYLMMSLTASILREQVSG